MMKSTLVTAALLFVGYPPASSQSNACATIAPTAPISEVGAFSNVRYTEEHAYGEKVFLWRSGSCVFGVFESAQGLQGDTPIGELQDVTHNPKTGELRFSARLTLGVIAEPASPTPQPSHDLFTFAGTLRTRQLIGGLIHTTQLDPRSVARNIVLPVSARDAEFMRGSATYAAWRAKWEPILQRRGPKW